MRREAIDGEFDMFGCMWSVSDLESWGIARRAKDFEDTLIACWLPELNINIPTMTAPDALPPPTLCWCDVLDGEAIEKTMLDGRAREPGVYWIVHHLEPWLYLSEHRERESCPTGLVDQYGQKGFSWGTYAPAGRSWMMRGWQ